MKTLIEKYGPKLTTCEEIGKYVEEDWRVIQRLVLAGRFPAFRFGGRIMTFERVIDLWIAASLLAGMMGRTLDPRAIVDEFMSEVATDLRRLELQMKKHFGSKKDGPPED